MKGTLLTKKSPGNTLPFYSANISLEKSMALLMDVDLNFYMSIRMVAYKAPDESPNLQ